MRIRAPLLALLLTTILLFPVSPVTSDQEATTIRVGLYENNPLIFTDNSGQPAGIYPDLLQYMADQENWQLEYEPCLFSECLAMLEAGDIDLMPAIAYSPERAEQFSFSQETVLANWGQIYMLPDTSVSSILDLEGKRIAVLAGDIHYQVLQGLLSNFTIHAVFIPASTYDTAFALVENGEADVALANRLVGSRLNPEFDLIGSGIVFNPLEIVFAAPSGDPLALLTIIDFHLNNLKDSLTSVYYKTLYRWMDNTENPVRSYWYLWMPLIAGGLLLLVMGGNLVLRRQVTARTRALQAEIEQRETITDSLKQRQRELESLLETSAHISQHLALDQVLFTIAKYSISLLDANECFLFRLDEEDNILRPSHVLGDYSEETTRIELKPGQGITGRCVAQNRPLIVNNAQDAAYAVQAPGTPQAKVEHVMVAPLVFADRITGALLVNRQDKPPFLEENLNLLTGLAQQAATAIENARLYQELENHNQALEQAVAERTMALQDANKRLSALSEMKDQFVSNVSNELRTPIASLKLRRYLIGKNPERQTEHLEVVRREIDRLENIVEDLLYLSRLDQHRIKIELASVRLDQLLEQYGSDRAPLANERGLSIHIEPPTEKAPTVTADERLLGQVLSILLTNALNYTPAGGQIKIRTETYHDNGQQWAGFSVSDTGHGIVLEEQARLFERFYRGTVGLDSGRSGTGLGLSIADEIIGRHKGRIEVASSGITGEGTRFNVWLPVAQTSGPVSQSEPPAP